MEKATAGRGEDTLHRAWQKFAAADFTSHALIRALTDELEYTSGLIPTEQAPEDHWRYRSQRMMSPGLWASVVEDLTGFRWEVEGFDLHRSDDIGYRILMGGVDGLQVYAPQSEPGVT